MRYSWCVSLNILWVKFKMTSMKEISHYFHNFQLCLWTWREEGWYWHWKLCNVLQWPSNLTGCLRRCCCRAITVRATINTGVPTIHWWCGSMNTDRSCKHYTSKFCSKYLQSNFLIYYFRASIIPVPSNLNEIYRIIKNVVAGFVNWYCDIGNGENWNLLYFVQFCKYFLSIYTQGMTLTIPT